MSGTERQIAEITTTTVATKRRNVERKIIDALKKSIVAVTRNTVSAKRI